MLNKKLFMAMLGALTLASIFLASVPALGKDAGPHGTITFGNGIYDASVEDSESGLGQYTAATGENHPVTVQTGDSQNVLYGGDSQNPGTSYLTIRSYTSETDYVNESNGDEGSSFDVVQLDPYAEAESLNSTTERTTYQLTGSGETPDNLTVVEDVEVSGSSINNSAVDITTTVTNTGNASVSIGIRYLWDWEIGDDDGPSFQAIQPDGPVEVTEQTYESPDFLAYRIQDNNDVDSPLFGVFGTVAGRVQGAMPPDLLEFVGWSDAFDVAFDYITDPSFNVASPGGEDDSATLYFWGPDSENAIVLDPGESVVVSESLMAAPAGELPPGLATPAPIRHRSPTPTPAPTETETPLPPTVAPTAVPTFAPMTPVLTATPSGGAGPAISAPNTGDGPSDSGSSIAILVALFGVTALVGATYARRATSRRS